MKESDRTSNSKCHNKRDIFSNWKDTKQIKFLLYKNNIKLIKPRLTNKIQIIDGLPKISLRISISLKLIPFLIPVPKALLKASFAANLLA